MNSIFKLRILVVRATGGVPFASAFDRTRRQIVGPIDFSFGSLHSVQSFIAFLFLALSCDVSLVRRVHVSACLSFFFLFFLGKGREDEFGVFVIVVCRMQLEKSEVET